MGYSGTWTSLCGGEFGKLTPGESFEYGGVTLRRVERLEGEWTPDTCVCWLPARGLSAWPDEFVNRYQMRGDWCQLRRGRFVNRYQMLGAGLIS